MSDMQKAIKNTARALGVREGKLVDKYMPKVGDTFTLGEFKWGVVYVRSNPVRISAEPKEPK